MAQASGSLSTTATSIWTKYKQYCSSRNENWHPTGTAKGLNGFYSTKHLCGMMVWDVRWQTLGDAFPSKASGLICWQFGEFHWQLEFSSRSLVWIGCCQLSGLLYSPDTIFNLVCTLKNKCILVLLVYKPLHKFIDRISLQLFSLLLKVWLLLLWVMFSEY